MSASGTRATDALRAAGIAFTLHGYDAGGSGRLATGRGSGERPAYGIEAAAALGVDPARVFKTLVATVDERPACALVPVSAELDLKAFAAVLGGRRAALAEPAAAERATGYVVGGISPFAQRRALPIVVDASALGHATVHVSAGRRGLQVELSPADLLRVTGGRAAPIARS